MKKVLKYFWHHKKISILFIVLISISAFFLVPQSSGDIETYKVTQKNLTQSIITSGKIESETSVKLNFLTPGKLVYVGAKKGDYVKKWQTIAALDSRTVQKNLQDDLLDYSKQRNTFDQTNADNRNAKKPDDAVNDTMKRILQNNQYDLEKSVISVELQSLAKEQSYLTSPIDGILVQADASVVGINVTAANSFIIADPKNVLFNIEVDEADIGKVTIGMPVSITLASFPDTPLKLSITKIDFASHPSSNGGNVFDLEAKFTDNPDYKYKIGMTGDAEIILSEKTNVLTIPLGSIFNNKYVYVKNKTGYEKREIAPGIQSDTDREIISGLTEGEEVAVLPDEVDKILESKKKFIFF